MFERGNGDGRTWRVDGHSAAIGVSERNHAIHVREARQQFAPDAVRCVFDSGRDALHCGRKAEDIAGPIGAVNIRVALKGNSFEWRQRRGNGSGERQGFQGRSGWHGEQLFPNPCARAQIAPCMTDNLSITDDWFALCHAMQRCLVRLRDGFSGSEPLAKIFAGMHTFRVHYDRDIVAPVDLN